MRFLLICAAILATAMTEKDFIEDTVTKFFKTSGVKVNSSVVHNISEAIKHGDTSGFKAYLKDVGATFFKGKNQKTFNTKISQKLEKFFKTQAKAAEDLYNQYNATTDEEKENCKAAIRSLKPPFTADKIKTLANCTGTKNSESFKEKVDEFFSAKNSSNTSNSSSGDKTWKQKLEDMAQAAKDKFSKVFHDLPANSNSKSTDTKSNTVQTQVIDNGVETENTFHTEVDPKPQDGSFHAEVIPSSDIDQAKPQASKADLQNANDNLKTFFAQKFDNAAIKISA